MNDVPALKRADVGVAVNGATDAAKAAASIVLTQDDLSTIMEGIIVSRKIFKRIKNFLMYRIAATLQLLCIFFIAVFWFKPVEYMPHDWKYIWIYCIIWWFIQDFCKVLVFKYLKHKNIFGINDTGAVMLPESTLKFIEDDKKNGKADNFL